MREEGKMKSGLHANEGIWREENQVSERDNCETALIICTAVTSKDPRSRERQPSLSHLGQTYVCLLQ